MDKVSARLRLGRRLRRPIRTPQAALTLPELLVAFGLLGLLSSIIFLTLQSSHMAQLHQAGRADLNTRMILARMNILDTLRGARLLKPTSGEPEAQILEFQKPRFEDGLQMVDILGEPLWGDAERIQLGAGGLLHYIALGGRVVVLAKLGTLGRFEVRREKPFTVIKLTFQDTAETRQEVTQVKAYMPLEVVLGTSSFGL